MPRPAMVFIHGDLSWDQLQLLISKSTNVDLLKMHCKLEEFFSQQFKSSKWVFSTLNETGPLPSTHKSTKSKKPVTESSFKFFTVNSYNFFEKLINSLIQTGFGKNFAIIGIGNKFWKKFH